MKNVIQLSGKNITHSNLLYRKENFLKPLGWSKRIGAFHSKIDYHLHDKNHRKVRNWWDFDFATNRAREKREVKKEIEELWKEASE